MQTIKRLFGYTLCIYGLYFIADFGGFFSKTEFEAPERRPELWMKASCLSILDNGTLEKGDVWKPRGCRLFTYTSNDVRRCMKKITKEYGQAYISIVGDSRMRTIARNLIGHINESSPLAKHDKTHNDFHYREKEIGMHLELAWEPLIDDHMMKRFKDWEALDITRRPLLVFAGAGNWFIRKYGMSDVYLADISRKLMRAREHILKLTDTTGISWRLQDPVKYKLLDAFRKNLTNENLNRYNKLAKSIFDTEGISVLTALREVALSYNMSDFGDGLHTCCKTARMDTHLLINYICNPFVQFDSSICCSINAS